MDPIRPVSRELPPVLPVRRRDLDEEAERRERERRERARRDAANAANEPPSGDEDDGPLIDVRA